MAVSIQKQFSTVETIQLLLKHREVLFGVIRASDDVHGNAIPEMTYFRLVSEYQHSFSRDVRNEIALVFDVNNLLQAKIINDRKHTDNTTKLWFNSSVMEIFRLCKISLFRPMTQTTLKASMTPLWSVLKEIEAQQISVTPGTEDYQDWLGEINHRITELLGNIKANISKLQQAGDIFQKEEKSTSITVTQQMYQEAAKLYRREVEPLRIFLSKSARYEQGDGIYLTLESFAKLFSRFGDTESQSIINSFQIQYLELFEPIKKVSDNISVYLRKTKNAIVEHNAIQSAFEIIRNAYKTTLSHNKRNKYINFRELRELSAPKSFTSISRISPCKLDKSPSYLNTVFNELAHRNSSQLNDSDERYLFEESVDSTTSKKIRHTLKLNAWINSLIWPLEQDYIRYAYDRLSEEWEEFSIPDLLEISSKLHTSPDYSVKLTNEYNVIEDEKHRYEYRVRLLTSKPKE